MCEVPWASNPANGKPFTAAALLRTVLDGTRPRLPTASAATAGQTQQQAFQLLGPLITRCWQGTASQRPSFKQVAQQLSLGLSQSGLHVELELEGSAKGVRPDKLATPLEPDIHRSHLASGTYNETSRSRAGRVQCI